MDAIEEYKIYKNSKLSADKLFNDKLLFKSNRLNITTIKIKIFVGNRSTPVISDDNVA